MWPASWKAAKSAGASRYFTGKACKRGHVAPHYVSGGCVVCVAENAERWHAANPEKAKEKEIRWRRRHPDKVRAKTARRYTGPNREKNLAASRVQRAKNPQKSRDLCARWRNANRDQARAATKDWERRNPDRVLANGRRRRARKNGATDHCTIQELRTLKAKSGRRCAICRKRRKVTIDHIKPLARGGSDGIRNIQFLCRPCNSAKGMRDPIDHAQSLGMLL